MPFINLHAHSMLSDGSASITCMAVRAKELGFSALVLTDHVYSLGDDGKDADMSMSYRRYKYAKKEAEAITKLGYPVIIGIELSVREIGEEIAVFRDKAINTIFKLRNRYKVITVKQLKTIRQHTKCVLNLCHPARPDRVIESGCHLILDGYEFINRCREYFGERYAATSPTRVENPFEAFDMIPLCNSDAHQVSTLSSCYNEVEEEITTEEQLIAYIKARRPFKHIVNNAYGDFVPKETRANFIF